MKSSQVRKTFLDFFKSKQHKIVSSAPMVVKNDPTLMFTNAGMNQFKDIFLGNANPQSVRVADTQKCLRVSGKHNDLEEVGHDTYHHTMFEMLGNWSFGDYFKKEAIDWGWELLTDVYKIDKSRLYVTVFGGDKSDGLNVDQEAFDFWKKHVPVERILHGSKKDNFWEMGDTGPCGPCSEIHVDLRSDDEIAKIPGKDLVNMDHPEVIEIWNLVFIEFNRKSNGTLEKLPQQHVDTGMGFERLCMVLQEKKSNYDTDVFQPIIKKISELSSIPYGKSKETDIALRVIADHLRAVAFSIADGQLPSNVKAGYVIRRILRRAVRYGYTFLDLKEPFIGKLVEVLSSSMGDVFPEINAQKALIARVITEEEQSFLKTLSQGIKKFDQYLKKNPDKKEIDGDFTFELFDTYGFPVDLTMLIAKEKGFTVDMQGFEMRLTEQKKRSKQAAQKDQSDWVVLDASIVNTAFLGYDALRCEARIVRYRKVIEKKKEFYQIVLDQTPFYAESGGQVGDRGFLLSGEDKTEVWDTQKENELIIHFSNELPSNIEVTFIAEVDEKRRLLTMNNHSATHLMHAALKNILGDHVEQKGSLVDDKRLRFDFSHFSKLTTEEIRRIENIVNTKIRENIPISEKRDLPMDKAIEMGAVALFGEKYGDEVRVITFDPEYSVELCGGTHVQATGEIGMFKIITEAAIAAGIRRIEAITAVETEKYLYELIDTQLKVKEMLKNQNDIIRGVEGLIQQNSDLRSQNESLNATVVRGLESKLESSLENINGINCMAARVELDLQAARDLAFALGKKVSDSLVLLGTSSDGKANLTLYISESLIKDKGLNAGNLIRDFAREIKGGGGGQPHFATAGGKDPSGIEAALEKAIQFVKSLT